MVSPGEILPQGAYVTLYQRDSMFFWPVTVFWVSPHDFCMKAIWSMRLLLNQCYCIAGNSLFSAGESEAVGSSCLHTYLFSRKMQMLCQMSTHSLNVKGHFGVFGDDSCVDVFDRILLLT